MYLLCNPHYKRYCVWGYNMTNKNQECILLFELQINKAPHITM